MSNYESIYNSSYLFNKNSYNELKRDLDFTRDKAAYYEYIIEKLEGLLSKQSPSAQKLFTLFNHDYIVRGLNITTSAISAFHDIVFENKELTDDLKELLMVNEIDWISPDQRIRVTQIIAGMSALSDNFKEIKAEYDSFLNQNINKIKLPTNSVGNEEDLFSEITSFIFPSQRVCALFYIYLQKAEYIEHFEKLSEKTYTKTYIYQKIAYKHGPVSSDNFRQAYSKVQVESDRINFHKEAIILTIPFLADYPKAEVFAKAEYETKITLLGKTKK
jgi:hypothetical protein